MEEAISWEPVSIDADADGFVQAVWSTARRLGAVSRTRGNGFGPPLQRSILGAIARRRHAFLARGPHLSVALGRYIAARFRVKNMFRTNRRRQKARAIDKAINNFRQGGGRRVFGNGPALLPMVILRKATTRNNQCVIRRREYSIPNRVK
jgi:hypothetical protein